MKTLVTGAASGLGRYAAQRLKGTGLTRANAARLLKQARSGVSLVFHAAGRAGRPQTSEELLAMVEDNVLLTQRLLAVPHKRFVFISTVDVYPRSWKRFDEGRPIPPGDVESVYGLTKLMAEALVMAQATNPLVLRCASLLGPDARPNAFSRILSGSKEKLTLSAASRLDCVHHEDVVSFTEEALRRGLTGIFNLGSSKPVTLGELARAAKRKPRFGAHRYDVGPVDNSKAARVWPALARPALETAHAFALGGSA